MARTKWKRNTTGLATSVRRRSEGARTRAEAAIDALVRERKAVNFNTVASRAGVTRAYLYAHDVIRERIASLR